MKQVLLHKLGNAIFVLELTGTGPEAKTVPVKQFQSWSEVQQTFLSQGAAQDILEAVHQELERRGNANLLL